MGISRGPFLGDAPTPDSYLRLKQNIDAIYENVENLSTPTIAASNNNNQAVGIIQDIHLARPRYQPTQYPNYFFYETDRDVLYLSANNGWQYLIGSLTGNLADLPKDLKPSDAGFVFQAEDYQHSYTWGGNSWNFTPGDLGSGFEVRSTVAGGPRGGNWGTCNGAGYSIALPNGNTGSYLTANNSNQWVRR